MDDTNPPWTWLHNERIHQVCNGMYQIEHTASDEQSCATFNGGQKIFKVDGEKYILNRKHRTKKEENSTHNGNYHRYHHHVATFVLSSRVGKQLNYLASNENQRSSDENTSECVKCFNINDYFRKS